MKRSLRALLVVLLAVSPSVARGAAGDLIKNFNLPTSGNGVSIAVDCNGTVYFTHGSVATLYRMDKNGANQTSVALTKSTGGSVFIDEFAWDETRKILWAQEHGTSPINIYQLNPTTGVATFKFAAGSSIGTFRDGIGYDGSDDTLWISGDVSTVIDHVKASDGSPATPAQITPKNQAGGALGSISGVIVGQGDLLYLGQNGNSQIVQVKKSDGSFISTFASPGGNRDEGLECDPVNFAPKLALWSREFFSPGSVSVIELAPGTCSCGGVVVTPGVTPTVITAVVPTLGGQGVALLLLLLAGAGVLLIGIRWK
ncbi:MAG TPA: hypothetical protein VKH43_05935 [Thermoanaerobaculia bacterium]|nr:hypothetical protein [Thermoanaerobaculia bacterium]